MHHAHRLIRTLRRWRSAPPAPPATDAELWYVLPQGAGGGFAAPAAHVSRSAAFPASEVRPGDVIWLFAGMAWGRRRLPEGLDAKIVVARVEREAGRTRFVAGPGSRWYPQADWSGLLADPVMAYETASGGRRRFVDHAHVGQALRNLRRLTHTLRITPYLV